MSERITILAVNITTLNPRIARIANRQHALCTAIDAIVADLEGVS